MEFVLSVHAVGFQEAALLAFGDVFVELFVADEYFYYRAGAVLAQRSGHRTVDTGRYGFHDLVVVDDGCTSADGADQFGSSLTGNEHLALGRETALGEGGGRNGGIQFGEIDKRDFVKTSDNSVDWAYQPI